MNQWYILFSVQLVILVCSDLVPLAQCLNLKELSKPENAELLKMMKEELDHFRIDMTKSFMHAHSRRKRALAGHVNDIEIVTDKSFVETAVDSVGPFSTFTFAGKPFVIQRDGIYQLTGLDEMLEKKISSRMLVQRGTWRLQRNEVVLNGYEWKHSFFLVTSTGNFSTIYTLHENSLQPIFRQNIHNKANAVGAEFFDYRFNLYMVILNDNEMHSTTFSPIFRWAGSYMDEIHQVQTTGASAVKTFKIHSKEYIAIAQSQDSTGNTEVGTMVLSMDHMDRLERVQLLWSKGAQKLHYMSTEKEHFLVIGQEKEPSIAYWFGGLDFIYWQEFEELQGNDLVMEGIQLNSDEPILLTSNDGIIRVFSRSTSTTKIMTTWIKSKTHDVFGVESTSNLARASIRNNVKISQLKILRRDSEDNTGFLAITREVPGSQKNMLRVYPVKFTKTEIAVSQVKEPGDSLSKCLQSVKTSLTNSEDNLKRIKVASAQVLTTNGDWEFEGEIKSKKIVKPANSQVVSAEISPSIGRVGERFENSPSKLMENIKQSNVKVEMMKSQLEHIFYKSKRPNVVTGDLTFRKNVQFNQIEAAQTNLQFETINGVLWENLDNFALKKSFPEPQEAIASWTVDSIVANTFSTVKDDSILSEKNFMLKSCEESQRVSGVHQFNKELKISKEVKLDRNTEINGIQFFNIVNKEDSAREIQGFKHVPNVKGKYSTDFVNNRNLKEWFTSVARLSGTNEQQFTGPVEIRKDAVIQVDNLFVDNLNEKLWDGFEKTVMLDGKDQVVEGLFNVEALRTDNIKANLLSGISSDELLTVGKNQHVTSRFIVENMDVTGSLTTGSINGISLSDAVNRNDKQVEINGRVTLENFQVQDVVVPEGVTISDKDVSELENLRKVHIYSTVDNSPIRLNQANVETLSTDHIDNENISDFLTMYWSKSRDNVANPAQLVLNNRKVLVSQGNFKTNKLNHFSFPEEFVSLDEGVITLRAPLQFKNTVKAFGDVTMAENAKIQGIDMSKAQSMIVDDNFRGTVGGVKTFTSSVRAVHGAHLDSLNGIDPQNDVVMLNSEKEQIISNTLRFDKPVTADQFTVNHGDVQVKGLVNSENLETVKQTTVYKNDVNTINGDLVFERDVNANTFSTMSVNDMNIKEITDNMIFLDSQKPQTIDGHIVLENGRAEFLMDSIAGSINNVPTHYLSQVIRLDSLEGQSISGRKHFLDAHLDKLMCASFNDVSLQDLRSNAFSRSKSQVVTGKWSIKNAIFDENLETAKIEEISLDNLVFTNEQVDVSSHVAFTSKRTNIQGPVSVTGSVNGIQFDESMKDGISIKGVENFDEILVDGDLDWTNSRAELEGLSYLFENAVTKTGPQTVTGNVMFSKGFESSEIHSPEKWFGNVDLQQIKEDALMKDSLDMVIDGLNEFKKPLKIQNLVQPVKNLDTKEVNNINLKSMSDDIVQSSDSSRKIKGTKSFSKSARSHAKRLKVEDKVGNTAVEDLVLADSDVEVGQVQFADLKIEENIESVSTDGLDLKSLLDDRVSLTTSDQNLLGEYSIKQVSVSSVNDCKVPTINDITIQNIMKKSSVSSLNTMSGKKVFKNLAVQGELETPSLNNHPVNDLLQSTLRVDRTEKITRPVIFEAPVIVNQQLEVESINDIHLERFSNQVSERISRLISDAESPEQLSNELSVQALKLKQITQERPVWLEYLRMKQDMTRLGLGAQTKVDHVKMTKQGDILVTLHRDTDGQAKGLPKGCNCNSIFTVNLKEFGVSGNGRGSQLKTIGEDNCLNVFNVVSPNKRSYTVISETVSSNTTCVTDQDSATKIFQGKLEISKKQMGHISDVGVFSEKETDFLVLAQYFDKNVQSHSTVTRVMRVDASGLLEDVQNIETHGAKKVALSKVNNIWTLAIANSKSSSDETSCNADSALYVWSSEKSQFLLLRTIMTDGAFDVQFITTETSNEFYTQSFVAFAQEGHSASGEVLIFRYEQPGGNFVMSQTIRSNWAITALRTSCICGQCFLVTAVPQEGITFYENRFVEGFQEYYKAPLFGATDVSGFKLDEQYLFAIATNKGPILAEAVIAGTCPNQRSS